jgi:hypothetical protein
MKTTTPLLAFHGNPKIKAKYLNRVKAHQKADEIVKGQYWQDGKGCAVGCTIHSSNHRAYETELGIPLALARLEDSIFEGLPNELAKEWPSKFLSAIELGADLSFVWPKFALWLLTDPQNGVLRHAKERSTKGAIQQVAELYIRWLNDDKPIGVGWEAAANAANAANAAYATANAAAYAANAANAANAAYATANAAAYAANAANAAYTTANAAAYAAYAAYANAYAAYAAYAANAAYAAAAAANAATAAANAYGGVARGPARIAQAEKLIELLGECK